MIVYILEGIFANIYIFGVLIKCECCTTTHPLLPLSKTVSKTNACFNNVLPEHRCQILLAYLCYSKKSLKIGIICNQKLLINVGHIATAKIIRFKNHYTEYYRLNNVYSN